MNSLNTKLTRNFPVVRHITRLCLVAFLVSGCGKKSDYALIDKDYPILANAIKNDEPATFQTYLVKGMSANVKNENGVPYIVLAATSRYNDIVRGLLNAGADANTRAKDGRALIHIAIDNNATDLIFDLLRWGANVNAKYPDGRTPLMGAIGANSPDMVRTLLDKQPDLTPKDDRGETAMSLAQKSGNKEIIALLEKAGAK